MKRMLESIAKIVAAAVTRRKASRFQLIPPPHVGGYEFGSILKLLPVIGALAGALLALHPRSALAQGPEPDLNARINDWQDMGCVMTPGSPGGPGSGAANAGGNQMFCPSCPTDGMPGWFIDEPYINLHISDVPLSYTTSSGQPMAFRFLYKQRYEFPQPDELYSFYNYSKTDGSTSLRANNQDRYLYEMRLYNMTNAAWSHNFMANIMFWDTRWESQRTPVFQFNYEALAFAPGGGIQYFKSGSTSGLIDAQSQVALQPLLSYPHVATPPQPDANGTYWGDSGCGFQMVYPDGSKDVFGLTFFVLGSVLTNTGQSQAEALLTQKIDPQGRATLIGYEFVSNFINPLNPNDHYGAWRIKYIVDTDGRTNTFKYETNSPKFAWQLTEIDDPYGRKATIGYNASGYLSGITDAMSNSSSFTYDGIDGWITNLTTPYGITSFSYFEERDPNTNVVNGFKQRATYVSEPLGAGQLFYFKHINSNAIPASTTSPTVSNYAFDDGTSGGTTVPQLYWRNSFHWDRRQFAALSNANFTSHLSVLSNAVTYLTSADYTKAHLSHWMLGSDGYSLAGLLSSERDPSPDAAGQTPGNWTFYSRPSTNPALQDSPPGPLASQINCIARLLPDNSSQYTRYDYLNPFRIVSANHQSYSLPNGTLAERVNQIVYSNNVADLSSVTNASNGFLHFAYNANHQVTNVVDALNQTNALSYDSITHNLTQVTFASGATIGFTYYSSNSPPDATSSRLQQVEFEPQGRFINFDNYSNGMPSVVRLSGAGLTSLSVSLFWNGLNQLTGESFPDGSTTSNIYTKLDVTAHKNRRDNWTHFNYDTLQHLNYILDASNNYTIFGWCGCGALSSITDASNRTTRLNYNNQGSLTNIHFRDQSDLNYTYDLAGRMTDVTDGSTRTAHLVLNNQGLPTSITSGANTLLGVQYDILDLPHVVTDDNGISVTQTFDVLNRLVQRSWASNVNEGFGYSSNGLVLYTNRDGKVTKFGRDNAGRLTSVTNAISNVFSFGYNAADLVTSLTYPLNGANRTTSWFYDEYLRLTRKADANGNDVLRLQYDANGNVTNRWTPAVTNTTYTYDVLDNLKSIQYPGSSFPSITYDYDLLNQLMTMQDAAGTTAFTYTRSGHLESEDGPWINDTLTYAYTQDQRTSLTINPSSPSTINYSYDSLWRMTNLTSPAGSFGYTNLSAVSSLVQFIGLPNGAYVSNHFDALKRQDGTALVNFWGHVLDGYTYQQDALGLRTNLTRDFGLTTNSVAATYDDLGQLTSWTGKETNGASRLNEQLGWGYDAVGNLHQRTNGGLVQTFTVDNVNQLTNITRSGTLTVSGAMPAPATNITVNGNAADRYGDLTFAKSGLSVTNNGNNTFTIIASNAYNVKVTNTLTANLPTTVSPQFDLNGNLLTDGTRRFVYDGENQLTNVYVTNQWKTEFVYDGLGRRRMARDYIWQSTNWVRTAETRFIWDGMLPVQERDSNNTALATYTRGLDLSGSLDGAGGIGGLLARTDATNGSTYYHADGAGNITALMDGNQNVVARYLRDPYGRTLGQWGPMASVNTMGFSSQPLHANSGLSLYPFRAYEPAMQRWLQRDPIGEDGGIDLYGFVGNSPVSYIDLFGLQGPVEGPVEPEFDPRDLEREGEITRELKEGLRRNYLRTVDEQFQEFAGRVARWNQSLREGRDPTMTYLEAAPAPARTLTQAELGQWFREHPDILEQGELFPRNPDERIAGLLRACKPKGGAYALRDPETLDVMRTGRSKNLERRRTELARMPELRGLDFMAVYRTDVYAEQRGLEQLLHETFAPPLNKINPIFPGNPNRDDYMDAARNFLNGGAK